MDRFTVALCQVRAFDIEDAAENLENLLRALDEAGRKGAQLALLPECSYPAYYLKDANPYGRPGVPPYAEVVRLFGAKAREYGMWVAAGMAVPTESGRVTNSGVVFGPDGVVRGKYDKSFLWHFDTYWFERGKAFPVFDMGFCKAGILVCADGRQPEVARSLAVNGAEIILDLTAWVTSGRDPEALSTVQCEYLMPTRAVENGVWVAAADKWGTEDGSIVYAGRSCVIDPSGVTRVIAPSTGDVVVTYEIKPVAAETTARRPALYGRLTEATDSLPVTAALEEAMVPAKENRRVSVVPGPGAFAAAEVVARFAGLRAQGADLVVFPGMAGGDGWRAELAAVEGEVRRLGGVVVAGVEAEGSRRAVVVTPEGTTEHVATHGSGALGEFPAAVVPTVVGNLGVLCGEEALVPEVARCLMLEGADVVAWASFEHGPMLERMVRTRSDENRVYLAAAWPGGGVVAGPNGAIVAESPEGSDVAMTASVNRAMSRWKDMAPGTHVVNDRVPEAYGALTR